MNRHLVPRIHHVATNKIRPQRPQPRPAVAVAMPPPPPAAALDAVVRQRIRRPLSPPAVRHLVYHCYPRTGSYWRSRILALRERLNLFNGRRIIAVVQDGTTDPAAWVYDALAGVRFTHLTMQNDPTQRERLTFEPLFNCVQDLVGSEHCTLWAHAKGVTRGEQANIQRWSVTQEQLMLDYWPVVEELLQGHACVGAFKRIGQGWPSHESNSDWHYSGSWFWFRHDSLFNRPDWRRIDRFWGAIESYPSQHWVSEDAAPLVHCPDQPFLNLYNSDYWETYVEPALQMFRDSYQPSEAKPVRDRLNVGCGPFYADGWWNTDFVSNEFVKPDQVVTPGRPLPFADGTFTAVYAGHVLEHIWWDEVLPFLRELCRVCRSGATVAIVGPDSKKVIRALVKAKDKRAAESKIWDVIEDHHHHQVDEPGEDRTGKSHLWNCYASRVVEVMTGAGFLDVHEVEWEEDCLPHWPVVDYSNPDQFAVLGVVP